MSHEKKTCERARTKIKMWINVLEYQYDFLLERPSMKDLYTFRKLVERFG